MSVATFFCSILAFAISLIRWPLAEVISWQWIVGVLVAGPIIGWLIASLKPYKLRDAAIAIDRTFMLKDRTQTALNFTNLGELTPLQQLQVSDAEEHVSAIDPARIAAIDRPRFVPATIAFSLCALLLLGFTGATPEATASSLPNETVQGVAHQAAEQLKELEALESEAIDEDVAN